MGTSWVSLSTVLAKCDVGWSGIPTCLVLTSSFSPSSLSDSISFDFPLLESEVGFGAPMTGATSVTLIAEEFSTIVSIGGRSGRTGTESSLWQSNTNVPGKASLSLPQSLLLTLTQSKSPACWTRMITRLDFASFGIFSSCRKKTGSLGLVSTALGNWVQAIIRCIAKLYLLSVQVAFPRCSYLGSVAVGSIQLFSVKLK